jgi:amidase
VSIDGLKVFYKSVLDARPWDIDPMALRMPWNEAGYELEEYGGGSKLCFGLQWHNKHVKPNPPYIRAMEKVRDALVAQGHSVVDFEFPDTETDLALLVRP